jgi:hypothetical protein
VKTLASLVGRLVDEWDGVRERQLISVLAREGLVGQVDVLHSVRDRMVPAIRTWVREGSLRSDVPVDLLVWELTAPLLAVRLLYFSAQSSPTERREGRRYARRHVEYFLATASP